MSTKRTDEHRDLVVRLADLLEDCRRHTLALLETASWQLSWVDKRLEVRDDPEGSGGLVITRKEVPTNVMQAAGFHSPRFHSWFAPGLVAWVDDARRLGEEMARRFREHLPYWWDRDPEYGRRLLDFSRTAGWSEEDPVDWATLHFVVSPADWYLTNLQSLKTPEPKFARQIAKQAIGVLVSRRVRARHIVPLWGITLDRDPLVTGDFGIRSLTPFERGEFLGDIGSPRLRESLAHGRGWRVPSHALHVDVDISFGDLDHLDITVPPRISLLAEPSAVLLALNLHGVELAGPGTLITRTEPEWLGPGQVARQIGLDPTIPPSPKPAREPQLAQARLTAQLLERHQIAAPASTAELALRRFALGCSRGDPADSLVDFVVALEALLLPVDPQHRTSDLSYRFRLHGAYFISDTVEERRGVFNALKDLYDVRSRLVHGGRYPDAAQIERHVEVARSLAARGLRKAVHTAFPTSDSMKRLALGEP